MVLWFVRIVFVVVFVMMIIVRDYDLFVFFFWFCC